MKLTGSGMIHLASGLAIRDGRVLLVASRYPNHPEPLWNLPGGRQQHGELLAETVAREVFEETHLHADVDELAYVSESYDGDVHYLNATFNVVLQQAQDDKAEGDDHVVAVEWVPVGELERRIVVAVVREPLLAYLRGALPRRYVGFHEAGITIEWPPDSR